MLSILITMSLPSKGTFAFLKTTNFAIVSPIL
jgi:hypothetical protein